MHQAEYCGDRERERDSESKGKIPKAVKKKNLFDSLVSAQFNNGYTMDLEGAAPKDLRYKKKNIISQLWRIYPDNISPQARRGERAALSMVMKRG